MDLNAEIFWSTLIGAVVGGLIPFLVTLAWSPSRERRGHRALLYTELVPAAVASAALYAATADAGDLIKLGHGVNAVYVHASLAGAEDRRVFTAVRSALVAAQRWAAESNPTGSERARMQQGSMGVLGTYIMRELDGYETWLGHSLNRNTYARRHERHHNRLNDDWAVAAREYIRQQRPSAWTVSSTGGQSTER